MAVKGGFTPFLNLVINPVPRLKASGPKEEWKRMMNRKEDGIQNKRVKNPMIQIAIWVVVMGLAVLGVTSLVRPKMVSPEKPLVSTNVSPEIPGTDSGLVKARIEISANPIVGSSNRAVK